MELRNDNKPNIHAQIQAGRLVIDSPSCKLMNFYKDAVLVEQSSLISRSFSLAKWCRMTLPFRSISVFHSVARTASISKAAAELGVTPSAVSQQIHALEIYLGTTLLAKAGRRIKLTEADIHWAEIIFVMEKNHKNRIAKDFRSAIVGKKIVCLFIKDIYDPMAEDLIAVLRQKIAPYLQLPEKKAA